MENKDFIARYIDTTNEGRRDLETSFAYAVQDLLLDQSSAFGLQINLKKIAKESFTTQTKPKTQELIMRIIKGECLGFMKILEPYTIPFLNNE